MELKKGLSILMKVRKNTTHPPIPNPKEKQVWPCPRESRFLAWKSEDLCQLSPFPLPCLEQSLIRSSYSASEELFSLPPLLPAQSLPREWSCRKVQQEPTALLWGISVPGLAPSHGDSKARARWRLWEEQIACLGLLTYLMTPCFPSGSGEMGARKGSETRETI